MEDIDGGLHPAVDGQSLDEDEEQMTGSGKASAWTARDAGIGPDAIPRQRHTGVDVSLLVA